MTDFTNTESNQEFTNSTVNDLLISLYHYYPVGTGEFSKNTYPGYQKLSQITDDKIQFLIANEAASKSTLFSSQMKTAFPGYEVLDQAHFHFPNYVFVINFSEKENEDYKKNIRLEICISLLVDYYTIFFEEQYRFKDNIPSMFTIRSFQKLMKHTEYSETVKRLQALLSENFPQKKYVSYKLLQDHKISGMTPYGLEINPDMNNYSLYDFLFSSINFSEKLIETQW